MEVVTFGDGRRALVIGSQKINLHRAGHTPQVSMQKPQPGSGHLCFITQQPIASVVDHLTKNGVKIELGPVSRTGARAELESAYSRDPDGNILEVANELI